MTGWKARRPTVSLGIANGEDIVLVMTTKPWTVWPG
jgi:hypothetical protein